MIGGDQFAPAAITPDHRTLRHGEQALDSFDFREPGARTHIGWTQPTSGECLPEIVLPVEVDVLPPGHLGRRAHRAEECGQRLLGWEGETHLAGCTRADPYHPPAVGQGTDEPRNDRLVAPGVPDDEQHPRVFRREGLDMAHDRIGYEPGLVGQEPVRLGIGGVAVRLVQPRPTGSQRAAVMTVIGDFKEGIPVQRDNRVDDAAM